MKTHSNSIFEEILNDYMNTRESLKRYLRLRIYTNDKSRKEAKRELKHTEEMIKYMNNISKYVN